MNWLDKVKANSEVLRKIIGGYHPASGGPRTSRMPITAPNAEVACDAIRQTIKAEAKEDPDTQFCVALDKGEIDTVYNILSDTWFGVPESTSCWSIEGFSMLVDLLDDPPDMPDDSPE